MASLKDIRKRIDSVKKTQKTTSAMKMVSAAKLRRAESNVKESISYSQELKKVLACLSGQFSEADHPFFGKTSGSRVGVILVTSDRGLCGGFNTNLCKSLVAQLERDGISNAELTIIGRKGGDFFKNTSHTIKEHYKEVKADEQSEVVNAIVREQAKRFENNELDRVYLVYNHFISVINQQPVMDMLLPIEPQDVDEIDEREFLFEPSPDQILNSLLNQYLGSQVNVAWLDSIAGEHAARMTAMDSATKNAGEMIDKLQLHYNRTRQAAITRELIEIISGAESL